MIEDDEPSAVTVVASDPWATEPTQEPGTFTVRRTRTHGDLAVSYQVTGTATNGTDYVQLTGTVGLPDGVASADIAVVPIPDQAAEGPETVVVTLTGVSGPVGSFISSPSSATVTIVDTVVTIAATDPDADESGQDPGAFTIARSDAGAALSVAYAVSGSATPGADYPALSGTAVIPAGQTSVTIPVNPVDDGLAEPTESVHLTLVAQPQYAVGSPGADTVFIRQSGRRLPVVTATATTPTTSEAGGPPGVFTVSRSGGSFADPLAVAFTLGGDASPVNDYAPVSSSVVIPAGAASATVPIVALADGIFEPAETVHLDLDTSQDYEVGLPSSADVTIQDYTVSNPNPPNVTVTATDPDAREAPPTQAP
jgi:Calx-beta domain